MKRIALVRVFRSPIGSFGGRLASWPWLRFALPVASRTLDGAFVDEVILGNVLSAGLGQNVARQLTLSLGLPLDVPAFTVNQVCASSLKALQLAWMRIRLGQACSILVGGFEQMSAAPFLLDGKSRWGHKWGSQELKDSILQDGLTDALGAYSMGQTAENLARLYQISRQEQDAWALRSQERAIKAQDQGAFVDELCPLEALSAKQEGLLYDEFVRRGSSLESLSRLKPAFDPQGTVTAGNSSGINDGAAFALLADEETCEKNAWPILAYLEDFVDRGVDPALMGLGPVQSIIELLERNQLSADEIDLWEINEAFSAQILAVLRELAQRTHIIDHERLNVHGGAIALGHPLGATGIRLLATLTHALHRYGKNKGIASLCVGGGMGLSVYLKTK